jgi:hypothetical protein
MRHSRAGAGLCKRGTTLVFTHVMLVLKLSRRQIQQNFLGLKAASDPPPRPARDDFIEHVMLFIVFSSKIIFRNLKNISILKETQKIRL